MSAVEIKDGISWIGIQDHDLRVFDVVMETEFGTSYNSYILKTPKFTVLFESVKRKWMGQFLENMREVCNPEDIDYIVVDHTEPDHAGSIEDLLKIAPKAKVVASAIALNFLNDICNCEIPSIVVGDNDEIKLDTCTLQFISVPFLHWPDSIYTYIKEKQTLVTCDSFGCHYADDRVCNDLIEDRFVSAYKYYFDMIMGPFKKHVRYALDRIKNLDITTICPGHGPVLRNNLDFYLDLYREWSHEEKIVRGKAPQVVCAYASAYGYTEELAQEIAKGIQEEGKADVKLYDMVSADFNQVLGEMANADGILFGSSTINGDALPPVMNLAMSLNGVVNGGKVAGAFGSYGWSGEAADMITSRLNVLRMKTIEPPLKVIFKPCKDKLSEARKFGNKFGKKLQEEWIKVSGNGDGKTYWKCTVCGEIFEGALPPNSCPVCGVGQEAFIEHVMENITFSSTEAMEVAIVGAGAAAIACAEAIRKRNKVAKINVYSSEKELPYFRPLLTKEMDKKLGDNFYLKSSYFYKEQGIDLHLGVNVAGIDRERKELKMANGDSAKYDKLLLATGARCFLPPIKGIELKGIIALRNKENLDELLEQINAIKKSKSIVKIVVVGGGVLGLETADSLSKLGCEVTVLEACPTILPRQMDADGQELLLEAINSSAVKVHKNIFVDEIYGRDKVEGVLTNTHGNFACDIVIVSAGIRSNLKLAQDANLETIQGIVVNEKLETADNSIYAAGDCALVNGKLAGLWDAALEQGAIAGANIVGDTKSYVGKSLGVTFHAFGVKMFSIGDLGFQHDKDYKTVMIKDDLNKVYKKIYFSNDVLVGGVLFGDVRLTNVLHTAINKKYGIEEAKDNKLI